MGDTFTLLLLYSGSQYLQQAHILFSGNPLFHAVAVYKNMNRAEQAIETGTIDAIVIEENHAEFPDLSGFTQWVMQQPDRPALVMLATNGTAQNGEVYDRILLKHESIVGIIATVENALRKRAMA